MSTQEEEWVQDLPPEEMALALGPLLIGLRHQGIWSTIIIKTVSQLRLLLPGHSISSSSIAVVLDPQRLQL